jgi:transposase
MLMAIRDKDALGENGTDLYVSFLESDSTWTKPKHTGQVLNSIGNESAPFLAADDKTLFFSSDGHAGYGSDDIFMTRRLDDTWTKWSKPQNLGQNINTKESDIFFTLPSNGDYAYFSSGGKEAQAIGHTRGGANSKLHAVVDGKGRLVKAMLTAGQVSDAKIVPELVAGLRGVRIVGDKGYDSQAIRQAACQSGSHSCIPRRSGSKEPAPFRKGYYRKRHHVENFFQRIKRCRRISTRYDKLADVFFNSILLAASLDWIHSF